jgi:hypothetical protein
MHGYFSHGTAPTGSDYADSFLGSYSEQWWVIPYGNGIATAYFKVTNTTDLNSLLHPEVTTGGVWQSVDGARPEFAFAASLGGLDMRAFTPQTQQFQWQEQVQY